MTYQKLKYIKQAGTTPDSGIPKKKRAARRPLKLFTEAIQHTIVPKAHMMSGKYRLPEIFFMSKFDGIKSTEMGKD